MFDGLRLETAFLSVTYKFSIGFKSGEGEG